MPIIALLFETNKLKPGRQKDRITANKEKTHCRHALGLNIIFNPDGTPRELSDESFLRATDLITEAGKKIFPTD